MIECNRIRRRAEWALNRLKGSLVRPDEGSKTVGVWEDEDVWGGHLTGGGVEYNVIYWWIGDHYVPVEFTVGDRSGLYW